jgi:tetratricopeptide (TPR) repeat protein
MKTFKIVCIVLLMASSGLYAQKAGKKIDDLTFLFVDEKYESVVNKAEALMQNDSYKKHPLIYVYASMAYYEMSRRPGKFDVGEKDSKYPKPLKMAQKHLYKFTKTDAKAKKYYDNQWSDDFKDYYVQLSDTSNKLGQMLYLNEKFRKAGSLYKAAFRAIPSDPVLLLWQGVCEMKSKNTVEGKKSLALAMKKIDENYVPTKATSAVLAHGMLLAEELFRGKLADATNADKAKKLVEVFKKYDPDELDKKALAEREAAAKKEAMENRVMRKFVSDADDKDNQGRKGKVIIDGKSTGGSNGTSPGGGNEDDELDQLEKEAGGGK